MQTIIIFFHGYGSSPQAEKYQKLAAHFGTDQVFAFRAPLDPHLAQSEVLRHIMQVIQQKNVLKQSKAHQEPFQLLLVGSSMGCWLACQLSQALSKEYQCQLLLINPCLDPAHVREQHPEHTDLLAKYTAVEPPASAYYFISRHDEVIDHSSLLQRFEGSKNVFVFENSDHRFNGPEFIEVIKTIQQMV